MQFGTALTPSSIKILLCGSGELGKELTISFQRLGVEVIAIDHYDNAPAMQVAHRSYVLNMQDPKALQEIIQAEKPNYIVPEVEALATEVFLEVEKQGFTVVPSAYAAHATMNRQAIREIAANKIGLTTTPFAFANSKSEFLECLKTIGMPCVIKPIMSSSGKGQSVIRCEADIESAWVASQTQGRTQNNTVILEGFVEFDYEITLLTVQHKQGIQFCAPIGHSQVDGDYRQSWQPHPMPESVLKKMQSMAAKVVEHLGGWGLFGVEFFVKGEEVIFSELSPRPHDTGMVTLISQNLSEFELHARAILGLPIPEITQYGPSASQALVFEGASKNPKFEVNSLAFSKVNTDFRLFAKPEISGKRRLGVVLARGEDINQAKDKAQSLAEGISFFE